jgi:hypothetical protein
VVTEQNRDSTSTQTTEPEPGPEDERKEEEEEEATGEEGEGSEENQTQYAEDGTDIDLGNLSLDTQELLSNSGRIARERRRGGG